VINTNFLHPILHRFRVIADYWLNFRFRQGFTHMFITYAEGVCGGFLIHSIRNSMTHNNVRFVFGLLVP